MPSFLRYAIFFSVVLVLLGAIHFHVFRRLDRAFGLGPRAKNALKAALVLGVVALFAGRFLERVAPAQVAMAFAMIGSVMVLGVLVAFAILVVESLVRGGVRGARAVANLARSTAPPVSASRPPTSGDLSLGKEPETVDAGRRDLLAQAVAATAVVAGGGSSLYATLVGRHDYVLEEVPIRLTRLPRELDGYTLVQLSDLHIGVDVGEPELAAALDLVRQARPDRIVLTGDLLDNDLRFADELGRFVRKLGEQAPVSAVVGNHDYYAGAEETMATLRSAGARVLLNGSQLIDGRLVLAGVDDVWARRRESGGPDVIRAFAGTDEDLPRVLLCHNPSYYPEAADHADLQLSGHTHGGQFSPLVNPARLVLRHGYIRGRYDRARSGGNRRDDGSQLYVNRGFGTAGPPARIGSPPEVTKIILTS